MTAPGLRELRIATRRSRLALWQAEHVKARLEALYGAPGSPHPGLRVSLVPLSTRGDELLEVSLAKAGGKGLFVKELEAALAEGRADFVAMGRKLLADPELPNKLAAGTPERVRPCLYQYRCIGNIFVNSSLACVAVCASCRVANSPAVRRRLASSLR